MILVDVYIPSLDTSYDFMLDENTEINKIIVEINEMISKKIKNKPIENVNDFLLYSMSPKKLLNKNTTLNDNGVKDGNRLLLV